MKLSPKFAVSPGQLNIRIETSGSKTARAASAVDGLANLAETAMGGIQGRWRLVLRACAIGLGITGGIAALASVADPIFMRGASHGSSLAIPESKHLREKRPTHQRHRHLDTLGITDRASVRKLAGRWTHIVKTAAKSTGVPAVVVAAVLHVESHGHPWSKSSAGAVGLMQIEPRTAELVGVRRWWHPKLNVLAGSRYLARLMVRFHDNLRLVLAAYNAGPTSVDIYGGVPPYPETQAYVSHVLALLGLGREEGTRASHGA